MSDPFRLSLVITHADGAETRWGPDELDASDIPTNLSCGDQLPGGFSELSCDLLRRIDQQQADQNLLDDVKLLGPGNEVVWEGRFAQFPRQTSDGFTVTPGAEGWAAHLRDDTSFREIYVDLDFNRWTGPSLVRRQALIAANFTPIDPSIANDSTTPALLLHHGDTWTVTTRPDAEADYDPQGVALGSIYVAWQKTNVDHTNGNYSWSAWLGDDATTSSAGGDSTGEQRAAGPGTATATATTSARKWGKLQFRFDSSGGTAGGTNDLYWTCLAVYGTHGLTKQGTASATAAQGFYAADVIAHALSVGAPLLTYTTGAGGTISATSIVLEHLPFLDPTTVEEVVRKCNAVHLWDWFVWENRTFYFQQSDPARLTWTVRCQDGTHLKDDGPSGQQAINKVFVSYTDPAGQQRLAGPTGATGCQVTDDTLLDTDPANPVNAHGIPTKSETIRLSAPSTDANAVNVGAIYLAERAKQERRGEAVVQGLAQHPTQGMRPCWAIRSGDYIQFVDTLDDSISEPRRIIKKTYDHNQRQVTLQLDSTPYTLEALLELLDAELVNVT